MNFKEDCLQARVSSKKFLNISSDSALLKEKDTIYVNFRTLFAFFFMFIICLICYYSVGLFLNQTRLSLLFVFFSLQ